MSGNAPSVDFGTLETPMFTTFRRQRIAMLVSVGVLAVSLVLQRFAIPLGEEGIDVVGPIGLLLAAMAVLFGGFIIDRRRLVIFLMLTLWLMTGAACRAIYPSTAVSLISVSSVAQFLLLNAFCLLSFAERVDEQVFFRWVTYALGSIAALGIVQFGLQFVGISIFSFTGLIPDRVLFESGYNLVIPTGIGSLNKSNGFFLLEPSIFSQFMAIGLIIEMLAFRRILFLALFACGIVLAFSGTGLLVLAAFLVGVSGRLGSRGLLIGFGSTIFILMIAGCAWYFVPEVAQIFLNRVHEFNTPGSSGYARFHTPLMALQRGWGRDNIAWLIGIGGGASRYLNLPFSFNLNTPIKVALEYGVPGLVFYTAMILRAERTTLQGVLVLPCLVLLFVAGSYEQFAPILFPVFLLICVARLHPSFPGAAA